MRVPLGSGLSLVQLIDEAEPDWRYTALCQNPADVARLALLNDRSPDAARVRALLANTLATSPTLLASTSSGLLRALEAAFDSGAIRLTSGRTAPLQRLAPYTPPAKPVETQPAPARVGKPAPAQPPPPEEETVADCECLKDAAKDGAPLVQPA